jgi:hypothetical protein
LGGEAVAVDEDAALAGCSATGGCDDPASGDGLDLVEVGAAPGAVGGEPMDATTALREVKRQTGK